MVWGLIWGFLLRLAVCPAAGVAGDGRVAGMLAARGAGLAAAARVRVPAAPGLLALRSSSGLGRARGWAACPDSVQPGW